MNNIRIKQMYFFFEMTYKMTHDRKMSLTNLLLHTYFRIKPK